jgi:Icc-related predicted phosphoesterase
VDVIPTGLADVLVVAGDLFELQYNDTREQDRIFSALARIAKDVLYIPGNHEHYRWSMSKSVERLRALCTAHGIRYLEKEVVEIAGQRFLGATLWFDPLSRASRAHDKCWSDWCINDFDAACLREHREGVDFLTKNVRKGDIVVTHMLPSYESVAPKHAGESTNCFFVTPLDSLIKQAQPTLWLHGHTHTPCDYKINHTRVVCSPLGGPMEAYALSQDAIASRLSCVIEV